MCRPYIIRLLEPCSGQTCRSRAVVELIAATKTKTGLTVQCAYDPNWYPTGEKISDTDFESIPLHRHDWHGDWNYTIRPA